MVVEYTVKDEPRQGEIEGLFYDTVNQRFLLHYNYGESIHLGMKTEKFYPGYDREISNVLTYSMTKK